MQVNEAQLKPVNKMPHWRKRKKKKKVTLCCNPPGERPSWTPKVARMPLLYTDSAWLIPLITVLVLYVVQTCACVVCCTDMCLHCMLCGHMLPHFLSCLLFDIKTLQSKFGKFLCLCFTNEYSQCSFVKLYTDVVVLQECPWLPMQSCAVLLF